MSKLSRVFIKIRAYFKRNVKSIVILLTLYDLCCIISIVTKNIAPRQACGGSYIIRKQGAFPLKFNTKLLHGGFGPEKTTGSTLTPIYQVSAFAQESAEQLEKVFNNKAPGYAYTRISNPTVAAFENRMNTLEKGVGAVACSSGMAAVTMSLLNILKQGTR